MDWSNKIRNARAISDAKLDQQTAAMARYAAFDPSRFFELSQTINAVIEGKRSYEEIDRIEMMVIFTLAYVGAKKVGCEAAQLVADAVTDQGQTTDTPEDLGGEG